MYATLHYCHLLGFQRKMFVLRQIYLTDSMENSAEKEYKQTACCVKCNKKDSLLFVIYLNHF